MSSPFHSIGGNRAWKRGQSYGYRLLEDVVWKFSKASVKLLSSFCVKSVEHKGQKRKLLLTEDATVYKVKRSKMENIVEAGKYI